MFAVASERSEKNKKRSCSFEKILARIERKLLKCIHEFFFFFSGWDSFKIVFKASMIFFRSLLLVFQSEAASLPIHCLLRLSYILSFSLYYLVVLDGFYQLLSFSTVHWPSSEMLSINLSNIKKRILGEKISWVRENQTWGRWVRSGNAIPAPPTYCLFLIRLG